MKKFSFKRLLICVFCQLLCILCNAQTQIDFKQMKIYGGTGQGLMMWQGTVHDTLKSPGDSLIPITYAGNTQIGWIKASSLGGSGGGGSGSVTSIGTTAPITGGTITTTGTIGITQATTSTDGYLSSTDWNTFNSKQAALTTGNLTANAPASFSATRQVIGGAAALSLDTSGAQGLGTVYGLSLKLSISTAAATYAPLTRAINTTSPLTGGGDLSADRTLAINNSAADGSTKGAASFAAADFDASSGNISIDYTNGQAASGSQKGFLIAADWTTFNSKQATISVTSPITLTGASVGIVNQGTTVQVLHGNAAGNASFSAVSLTADVSGVLPLANGGTNSADYRSATETLSNKFIRWRADSTTSSATPTINTDNVDYYALTAQAAAITSFTTNLSGSTHYPRQTLWISIQDNGTARAITWGASFEASGTTALPTTTVISTRLDVGFVWNERTSKWRCIAVS